MTGEKLRIIVGGMVGQFPMGGVAWDYFHYVLGLAELGHEVVYHEDTRAWPGDPVNGGGQMPGATYTRAFLAGFFRDHAPHMADRWHYLLTSDEHIGMSAGAFDEFARSADVFLNVSGACFIPDALPAKCRTVFLDTDPGCNQIPIFNDENFGWEEMLRSHDRFLTYAENLYADDCTVPRLGLDWRPTRCVVTLEPWGTLRDEQPPADAPFTTIMGWDYTAIPYRLNGREYGRKVPEFERFYEVCKRTAHPLRVAVGGDKAPIEQLQQDGWDVVPGRPATLTPDVYVDFIRRSRGEWSIAKEVYVAPRTGWFSCRTACYLAAGRPAVVQDTAWTRYVPSGAGCIGFSTVDEAVAGLDAVAADPARHQAAAYDVAREYLAPDRVLPPMLEAIFASPRDNPADGGDPLPPSA